MMSGFVKAAGNATRPNTNLCLSSFFNLQSSLRLRESSSSSREGTPYSARPAPPTANGRQDLDELPEGPLVNRKIVRCTMPDLQDPDLTQPTCVKEAEYLMSFPVIGENGEERAECMKSHLAELRETNNVTAKAKPVVLVISLSGIKVYSSNRENIYMAHALKRISYASCQPERCQFSFLAREPKANGLVQYCHIFITKTPDEASILNTIVSHTFTMAYASKRADSDRPALTFHDVIQNQIEACKEQFEEDSKQKQEMLTVKLSQISTPLVDQIAQQRKERRLKEQEEPDQPKPPGDQLKLQSQVSGDGPSTGTVASSMKAALSLNLNPSPDVDQQTLSSISRILEVLNSGETRSHGSPVTILKDTIDMHFRNGLSHDICRSPLNSFADDQSQFSMVGPSTLLCQGTDLPSASPLSDGFNILTSQSSQKPAVLSQTSRADPLFNSRPTQDVTRSKVSQFREPTNSDIFPRSVPLDPKKVVGMAPETREDSVRKNDETSDANLREAAWYKPGIAREIVLEMLSQLDSGSFIVRDSLTHPGCYALSIKIPAQDGSSSNITHYLIMRTTRGTYKLKGLGKEWNSLTALVTHHTVMKEILPCLLILPNSVTQP